MGILQKLKEVDLFSTKIAIEKKQKSFIGVIFSLIMVIILIAYGVSSTIATLNTPFIWEVKEIQKSQEYTGKFIDYPFEKKLSLGFSPLILGQYQAASDLPLTDYGELKVFYNNGEWPITDCITDESQPSEVSCYE